jgi:hypothetical protein
MTVNVADITSNSTAAWLIEVSELMVELEIYWPYPFIYKPLLEGDKDVNLLSRIGSFLNPAEKREFASNTSLQDISVAANHSVILYTAPREVVSQTSWWSSYPKTDAIIREANVVKGYESNSNSLADLFNAMGHMGRPKSGNLNRRELTKNNILGRNKTQHNDSGLRLPNQLAKSTHSSGGSGLLHQTHSRESVFPHFTMKSGGKSSVDVHSNNDHVPQLTSLLIKKDDMRQSLMPNSDKDVEQQLMADYSVPLKRNAGNAKFDGLPNFTQVNDEPISLDSSINNSSFTLDKIQSSIVLLEKVTKQEFRRQREMNAKLEELLNSIMSAKDITNIPGEVKEYRCENETRQITDLREDIQELSSIVNSLSVNNGQQESNSIFAKLFGSGAVTKAETVKQPTKRALTSKKLSGKVDVDDS